MPFKPDHAGAVDYTDPANHSTLEEVLRALSAGGYAGIGFAFMPEDGFTGIDLDECVGSDGAISPAAVEIIRTFNTYTEYSPSGTGVHLILRGSKPAWAQCKSKAVPGCKLIEIYDCARFFTMTGRCLPGTPAEVRSAQTELEALCTRLWPEQPPTTPMGGPGGGFAGDDAAILAKMFASKNGPKIKALFEGDLSAYGGDQSSADLALCSHLAFWTGRDAGRIDAIFRLSKLMRPKWDSRRGNTTYGAMTVAKAIANCKETYEMPHESPKRRRTDPSPVLDAKDPVGSADQFIKSEYSHADGRTLHYYQGEFFEWKGNCFRPVEDPVLRGKVYEFLGRCRELNGKHAHRFRATCARVENVLDALRGRVVIPRNECGAIWLQRRDTDPDPSEVLPVTNGLVHLDSGRLITPTPRFFNTHSLPVEFDPKAPEPQRLLSFLRETVGDQESIDALQEFVGLTLTAETRFQTVLLLIGPPRSGKGTFLRLWTSVLGHGSVASPKLSSFAERFGLAPLIGKLLATIADARLSHRGDTSRILEQLLSIPGEDLQTIPRKYKEDWTGKMGVRFVIVSNEVPRLPDAAAALHSRALVVEFPNSFKGREDPDLERQLLAELPAVLLWMLKGRSRLLARGRFTQPATSKHLLEDLQQLASPVAEYANEQCELGVGCAEDCGAIYKDFRNWAELNGITPIPDSSVFGRDLKAAFPTIRRDRPRNGSSRSWRYVGICRRVRSKRSRQSST